MDDVTSPNPVEDLDGFVRIPGVFRRSEIEQVLRPGCDFHIQPERIPSGTHLFTVYQQAADDAASWPVCGPGLYDHGGQERDAAVQSSPRNVPEPTRSDGGCDDMAALGEPSLGELKARHREEHLCLRCSHHLVCGMAKSLDRNLLVTVANCLGFEPVESDTERVCELVPIEPVPQR